MIKKVFGKKIKKRSPKELKKILNEKCDTEIEIEISWESD